MSCYMNGKPLFVLLYIFYSTSECYGLNLKFHPVIILPIVLHSFHHQGGGGEEDYTTHTYIIIITHRGMDKKALGQKLISG